MKYDQLISDLKRGKLLPVYLFFGDEAYLVQEAVDLIVRSVVDPSSQDFNFNTLYGKAASGMEIVTLCQTLPFMAERRLVIVKEIEALKAGDLEDLVAYLRDPSPGTCLVMVSHQSRYDKKAVVTAVEAQGVAVRFFPLLDREMVPWIDAWVRSRGLSIQRDAAQYVWQTLGNDLLAINNELQKAVIYIKERKAMGLEDVRAVVGDFREYSSFDLADAVGRKDRERALLVLNRLVQEGEQPVGLLASIAWNFRRLLRAKSMEASGTGYEEIKKKLHVIFHQSAAFQEQMRRYTLQELEQAFTVMTMTDRALKSGGLNSRLVLERMVLQLCGT